MPKNKHSAVASFYENRSVFITGATGFIGKVLLEKLLRSCPGIRNVFILIREKKGKSPNQRCDELMSSKIFDLVKNEHPEAITKVVAVVGDILLPFLGLSEPDIATIIKNVSVVFHSAATTRFEEPLKQAVDMNVLGTRRILDLCRKLERIEALIHVSTAYSNCNRREIEEVIYRSPVPYEEVISMTENLQPDLIEVITPKIIADRAPNTYTFTKALGENLLDKEYGSIPVAIIRPSIVSAAWKEPFPGWIDYINGTGGIVVIGGKGILRSFIAHGEVCAEIIPVDVVSNLMITAAWHTAAVHRADEITVYNCTSGSLNKTTWSNVFDGCFPYVLKYPSAEIFQYPHLKFRRTRLSHYVHAAFQHFLIAFFVDILLYVFHRKLRMIKLYQKVHKAADCLQYFTTHEWNFHCENVQVLNNLLSKEDQEKFYLDIRSLNWNSFWENHVLGLRKFLLKEDPSTIPAARRNLKIRYVISQVGQVVLLIVLWIIFSRLLSFDKLWHQASATAENCNHSVQNM